MLTAVLRTILDKKSTPRVSVVKRFLPTLGNWTIREIEGILWKLPNVVEPFSMPLCVVRGGDEAFCSSHDLLGSAVAVQMCSGAQDGAAATVAAKAAVLQRLQRDVFALVEREGDSDDAVARGYLRFQAGFREYMAFYPGSVDLRFRALGDVDPRSAVCTQAAAHLRAIARLEGCDVALDSDRYVDVLRAYLRLLHAYGRE